MANKVYDSPGYYASEKDLTFSTEVVGITTLGLVGETVKGPAMQPIFIKNYDQFKVVFGGTNPAKYKNTQIPKYELAYIAKAFLSQTNQLYVTRVLGLSGYDAKAAHVLRTVGNADFSTLNGSTTQIVADTTGQAITFHSSGSTFYSGATGTDLLIDYIADLTGVAKTEFDTEFNRFFSTSGMWQSGATSGTENYGLYWGTLPNSGSTYDVQSIFDTKTYGYDEIDAYELPTDITSDWQEKHWLLNTFTFDPATNKFTGHAFALYVNPTTTTGSTSTLTLHIITYTCDPMEEYHNKTIATLRIRGYYDEGDIFQPDIITNSEGTVSLANTTAVMIDPFATFEITGVTKSTSGNTFSYTVNLDTTSGDYIKNVLGSTTLDNGSYLFVEEFFPTILTEGYNKGYVRGLSTTIEKVMMWDKYQFGYQSPVTPFFVSELRGGLPQRLFRFISISDGNSANTEIKASIANININTRKFDVYIRKFTDVDRSPSILERFFGCTMDPTSLDFIGRKIGTSDNMFELVSNYVMVDLDEMAPVDAVPAGFEGFSFRTGTSIGVPQVAYKLKYYHAGEEMYTEPFGSATISSGDKLKKNFLGFSDTVGIDSDLLQFKGFSAENGLPWTGSIKGFHMDINAENVLDANGNLAFEVGSFQFSNVASLNLANGTSTTADDGINPYPNFNEYRDIRARQFTACFTGGFDGWDIYRYHRTNEDTYKIGGTGYQAGLFTSFYIDGNEDQYATSDYYAYLIAIQTMQNPEDVNINILATPGIDMEGNTELVRETLDIIEEKRQDAIYLPTLPDMDLRNATSPSDTDWIHYPADIVALLDGWEIDSNYSAVYYPWYQVFDGENNTNVFISPTTDVVRNLALTDNIAHPWYATAGYKRGLVNAKRTRFKLTQENRDTLYVGRINPLATFSDVGVTIWGNRNLQVANSALNRLNIRRLLLQCKKLIGRVGNRLLFDPNDDTIRNEFLSLVNPILDNIRKERGLVDFRVKLEPQADGDDRNTLRGKIYLKPTPALEVIDLEFVVTPTNVSFDNF